MSNSTHTHTGINEGLVTSLAVPFWIRPGFAIPLIQSRISSNITYVQRIDSTKRIAGFDLFQSRSSSVAIEPAFKAQVGDPELFAFIDLQGDPHVGTQDTLAPIIRNWVAQIGPPLIRMSFARFCGNERLAIKSASEAVAEKSSELKSLDRAILWFLDTVVAVELLEAMGSEPDFLSGETFEKPCHTIELTKKELTISMPPAAFGRGVVLPKFDNLMSFLRSVFERDVLFAKEAQRPRPPLDPIAQSRVQAILARIGASSRQEQRLALLIRSILEDPPWANAFLTQYSDNTRFMQRSLMILREALRRWSNRHELEQQIAQRLREIISGAHPKQRGRLLLALAEELGSFHLAAGIIREKALQSRSQEVEKLKDQILERLA